VVSVQGAGLRSAGPATGISGAENADLRPRRSEDHERRINVRTWGQTGRDLRIAKLRSLTLSKKLESDENDFSQRREI
jgi:hypothetical protein